jgi:FtsP/CotA-like multicopper oxidase with cupredoxin domain
VNPNFRTAALIAATLGLLVSLFLVLRPNDEEEGAARTTSSTATTEQTTTEQTTTAQTATTAPAEGGPLVLRVTVPADTAAAVKRFSVRRGRQVELVVDSALADEIHVHGYDLSADVTPGVPATIAFTADAPGRFEIELESRGIQIAELEVRP